MRKFKFPSAYTTLYIIIIISALATWLLPAGSYDLLTYTDGQFLVEGSKSATLPGTQATLDSLGLQMELSKFEEGKIKKPVSIPNTYEQVDANPQGLKAILFAPIKGIYDSIDIILLVIIIGGFIGVFQLSGALERGVGFISEKLEGREKWLIIITMTLIALGGTTFGMQEETIAFYPILVPIFIAAGYDLLVPVAAIYIGSCIGLIGATVNPFSTIIASDAAGVSWTLGLYSRLIMMVLTGVVAITYVVRYAERVKADPTKSLLHGLDIKNPFAKKQVTDPGAMTPLTWVLLTLFALSFIVMVYGVAVLGWWLEEMTALFLAAALIIGLLQRTSEAKFVEAFIDGAKDLLGVALIIGIARGITIMMNEGMISGTLLNEASDLVSSTSPLVFLPVLMIVFFVLAFFISSSSGLALVSMPIMGALGNVVGVPSEEIVNAYLFGFGMMQLFTPSGLVLPSLAMVNVPYNVWVKFNLKLLYMLAPLGAIVLILGYLL
ncbi:YfcC family protein [Roseivirga spongicola]|uniref:YfcC family protein n=1 Tax=Roseivirga spongicola TaxID=333140 RepID=UPI002AC8F317|nr:YfcC family protein [Roseivirga spongicola]WPZ10021.1 YfcC family protein [Roseivirga spongicola]